MPCPHAYPHPPDLRIDPAWRLIGHEARTLTIRQWTGLSDDRIRKLYRSYCQSGAAAAITRQAAFFFRNPEVTFHAAQLASLYLIYGLVGVSDLPAMQALLHNESNHRGAPGSRS